MAENDDAVRNAAHEVDILRDAARSRIATQLLAGALANSSTTFPSIFMIDCDGPDYGASYKSQAKRMVKNSVTLADMLLEELEKAEYEYSKSVTCICSEDAGGLEIPFDPKCPQHGTAKVPCPICGGAGQIPKEGQLGAQWLTPCPACKK